MSLFLGFEKSVGKTTSTSGGMTKDQADKIYATKVQFQVHESKANNDYADKGTTVQTTGFTMTGNIDMGSNKITNLPEPQMMEML